VNPIFAVLVLLLVVAQLVLPRRYAFAPLLVTACHLGNAEFIGELTPARMLILVGLARAVATGQFRWSPANRIDLWFAFFAVAALVTATAHLGAGYNPFVANCGLILNVCGTYLYGRAYLRDEDWPFYLATVTALVVIPLGILMFAEYFTAKNYYSLIGITGEDVLEREGGLRARGPFSHPILGGTAGAVCLPLCIILWQRRRWLAKAGLAACAMVVFASGSSGPMAAAMACCGLLWFWKKRHLLPRLKYGVIFGIIFLVLYMERPFYYIIDSIDLAGGSTGWHRARLIEMGIEHLSEWWLAGTDYTRHWMPTGVSWNPNHTDITNYYLHLGVIGGLPLMLALIAIIYLSFRNLSNHIGIVPGADKPHEFTLWCVGTALFAHALSFVSISYFDQMYVLFYLLVGGIAGIEGYADDGDLTDEENETV
jgi:hypothetical protein